MSSPRISIGVWRTDAPTGDPNRLVLARFAGQDATDVATARSVAHWMEPSALGPKIEAWAELPAPREATLGDLTTCVAAASIMDDEAEGVTTTWGEASARLRALLGGDS